MSEKLSGHLTYANTARIGTFARVYLDGEEVKECTEAHTEEGWLIQAKTDEAGRFVVEGGEIATVKRFGRVEAERINP